MKGTRNSGNIFDIWNNYIIDQQNSWPTDKQVLSVFIASSDKIIVRVRSFGIIHYHKTFGFFNYLLRILASPVRIHQI